MIGIANSNLKQPCHPERSEGAGTGIECHEPGEEFPPQTRTREGKEYRAALVPAHAGMGSFASLRMTELLNWSDNLQKVTASEPSVAIAAPPRFAEDDIAIVSTNRPGDSIA